MMRSIVLSAMALALTGAAAAQPSSDSDELVVTGQRLRDMAQQFASVVAEAPEAENQYARWHNNLCTSVAGLAPAEAQTLIDHIGRRAHAVGLEIEPSGCRPNLIIIFAPDANRVAREIVDTRRDLMGYYTEDDVITGGREALEQFATRSRPIRWWHVSHTTTADGRQLTNSRSRTGRGTRDALSAAQGNPNPAVGNGFEGVEATRAQGTRTRRVTRQDINFALVIVDGPSTAGLPPGAVADYIAMAALVQLDPDADMTAFPTVLNLFADRSANRAPIAAMTEWDVAYLDGLYSATREAANTRVQDAQIARRIVQQLSAD